jgi:hypothetical protein
MPITPYLDGANFDPETRRVMGLAFEMSRAALRLADRADPAIESRSRKKAFAIRISCLSGRWTTCASPAMELKSRPQAPWR